MSWCVEGGEENTLKPATVPIRQRSGCAVDYVGYYGLICCVISDDDFRILYDYRKRSKLTYVKFSVVYKYVLSNTMPVLDNL